MTYRSLMNLISATWAIWRSYARGWGVVGEVGVALIGLFILDSWGGFVGVFRVGGESHERR